MLCQQCGSQNLWDFSGKLNGTTYSPVNYPNYIGCYVNKLPPNSQLKSLTEGYFVFTMCEDCLQIQRNYNVNIKAA